MSSNLFSRRSNVKKLCYMYYFIAATKQPAMFSRRQRPLAVFHTRRRIPPLGKLADRGAGNARIHAQSALYRAAQQRDERSHVEYRDTQDSHVVAASYHRADRRACRSDSSVRRSYRSVRRAADTPFAEDRKLTPRYGRLRPQISFPKGNGGKLLTSLPPFPYFYSRTLLLIST